jgi:membrane protein DedA with SNARE-associated domain
MQNFISFIIAQLQAFPVWQLVIFSFVSACLQQIFPPYPSDVLLLFFGGLAVSNVIAAPAAIIPYVIGTVFSSLILFYFSRHAGSPILNNRYIKKFFPRYQQRKARVYMRHYGTPALAFCKFLPGVNTVCLIVAGVIGLRGLAPLLTIVFTGIVQNSIYFFAGMIIGDNIPNIYGFSKQFSLLSGIIAGVLVLLAVLFIVYKTKTRHNRHAFGRMKNEH